MRLRPTPAHAAVAPPARARRATQTSVCAAPPTGRAPNRRESRRPAAPPAPARSDSRDRPATGWTLAGSHRRAARCARRRARPAAASQRERIDAVHQPQVDARQAAGARERGLYGRHIDHQQRRAADGDGAAQAPAPPAVGRAQLDRRRRWSRRAAATPRGWRTPARGPARPGGRTPSFRRGTSSRCDRGDAQRIDADHAHALCRDSPMRHVCAVVSSSSTGLATSTASSSASVSEQRVGQAAAVARREREVGLAVGRSHRGSELRQRRRVDELHRERQRHAERDGEQHRRMSPRVLAPSRATTAAAAAPARRDRLARHGGSSRCGLGVERCRRCAAAAHDRPNGPPRRSASPAGRRRLRRAPVRPAARACAARCAGRGCRSVRRPGSGPAGAPAHAPVPRAATGHPTAAPACAGPGPAARHVRAARRRARHRPGAATAAAAPRCRAPSDAATRERPGTQSPGVRAAAERAHPHPTPAPTGRGRRCRPHRHRRGRRCS